MLELTDISAGYAAAGPVVLRHIGLHVRPGERVALLGPNGSGKTSLLRCITGQMPLMLGKVHIQGRDAGALSASERARQVAVLPQRAQYPQGITARDMVLLGRYAWLTGWQRLAGHGKADIAVCDAALASTGSTHLAKRQLDTLSGGELQRVLLARALAQQTPLLLLDELTASLDVAHAIFLFEFLTTRTDKTIVMVMHDCNLAARYATRLIGLKHGQTLFDGPTAAMFTKENLHALYDMPFTVFPHPTLGMAQALPDALPDNRHGTVPDPAPVSRQDTRPPDPRAVPDNHC